MRCIHIQVLMWIAVYRSAHILRFQTAYQNTIRAFFSLSWQLSIYCHPNVDIHVVHVHDDKAVLISEAENRNRWANKSECIRPNLKQTSTFPNNVGVCASACAYSLGISKSARKVRHFIRHEKPCCVCRCVCVFVCATTQLYPKYRHIVVSTSTHECAMCLCWNVCSFCSCVCALVFRTLVKRCQPACRVTFCSCIIQYMHVAMNVVSAVCKNVASQI